MWFGRHCGYLSRRNILLGPQLLGIDLRNGSCTTLGGITGARTTRPIGPPPSCLFRCPSGSFTPPRFARPYQRQWFVAAWRSPAEPSRHMAALVRCGSTRRTMAGSRYGQHGLLRCMPPWSVSTPLILAALAMPRFFKPRLLRPFRTLARKRVWQLCPKSKSGLTNCAGGQRRGWRFPRLPGLSLGFASLDRRGSACR
jgi:hypothetical protein